MKKNDSKKLAQALLDLTEEATKPQIPEIIGNFVSFLKKKGIIHLEGKILKDYSELYNQLHNHLDVRVTVKEKMTAAQVEMLAQKVKKRFGKEEVYIEQKIDPQLIGGIKIKVGDLLTDQTIDHSVEQFKNHLIKNI